MPNTLTKQKTIYLDNAATTPLDLQVWKVMQPILETVYGNPSSMHSVGRIAHDELCDARERVAQLLGASPEEIIFTGSGTESDNLALFGVAHAQQKYGKHIIVSEIEHKAVLGPARSLERAGLSVTYLPVDTDGLVRKNELIQALRDDTILVSIMYANNEIGTVEPIQEIAHDIREHYARTATRAPLLHTDACQATGMLTVFPSELGVDLMTLNGSKMYGPKGVGLLYKKKGTAINSHILGGNQEYGLRAGTENVALIAGFAKALELALHGANANTQHMRELQHHFIPLLYKEIPNLILNGHKTKRLPNNVSICIPDIEGESAILMLDMYGICCSTGSACSTHDLTPSHVLHAIGMSDEIIHGSLRFSFGKDTTKEDLSHTAHALGEVVKRLREMTASTVHIKKQYEKNT